VVTIELDSSEFDPILYLLQTDPGPAILIQNDNRADDTKSSRISMSLPAGQYRIAAAQVSGFGAYTLKVSFRASPSSCPVTDLAADSASSGSIAGIDCWVQDTVLYSSDASPTRLYRITMPRRGVLTMTMESADFDASLRLFNGLGTSIGFDDNSAGDKNARLTASLDTGQYLLYAMAKPGTQGTFQLRTALSDVRTCATAAIGSNDSVTGELSESDCRGLDIQTPSSDATYLDIYRLQLSQRTVLTVQMDTEAIRPYLWVTTTQGRSITAQTAPVDSTKHRFVVSLAAGNYVLFVNSFSVQTGSYTLTTRSETPRTCTARDLSTAASVSAALAADDCRFVDLLNEGTSEFNLHLYRMTVARQGLVTFSLASADFNTIVYILDSTGELITSDDDGGGGTNSKVTVNLPADTYFIVVTPSVAGTGSYTFDTSFRDLPNCPFTQLGKNSSIDATLSESDCTIRDVFAYETSAAPLRIYQVTSSSRGLLRGEMGSGAFAPLLALFDPSGQRVGSVQGAIGKPAIIELTAPAGKYTFVTVGEAGKSGAFTFKVSAQ
jgi:hypothetical protein